MSCGACEAWQRALVILMRQTSTTELRLDALECGHLMSATLMVHQEPDTGAFIVKLLEEPTQVRQ